MEIHTYKFDTTTKYLALVALVHKMLNNSSHNNKKETTL